MTSQYQAQHGVDLKRQQNDLMYHILVNSEANTLNEICDAILKVLNSKYEGKSIRFENMLRQTIENDDRVAKHALLFFALFQEPEITNIFLKTDKPRVPPEKFTAFVRDELPPLVNKLMNGAYTSLRAFVEDTRWTYVTL